MCSLLGGRAIEIKLVSTLGKKKERKEKRRNPTMPSRLHPKKNKSSTQS
jgi:hypothetical protein